MTTTYKVVYWQARMVYDVWVRTQRVEARYVPLGSIRNYLRPTNKYCIKLVSVTTEDYTPISVK